MIQIEHDATIHLEESNLHQLYLPTPQGPPISSFFDSHLGYCWSVLLVGSSHYDYLDLHVIRNSSVRSVQSTSVLVYVITSDRAQHCRMTHYFDFSTESNCCTFSKWISLRQILEFTEPQVEPQALQIHVTITLDSSNSFPNTTPKSGHKLALDLLTSGYGSDLTLVVQGVEISVHRAILGSASPVFARMLNHLQPIPVVPDKVIIEGLPVETVKQLLLYVYAGQVPQIRDLALGFHLLIASHKYELYALKHLTERTLARRLSASTALTILRLAKHHRASQLVSLSQRFIADNFSDVLEHSPEVIDGATDYLPTWQIVQRLSVKDKPNIAN